MPIYRVAFETYDRSITEQEGYVLVRADTPPTEDDGYLVQLDDEAVVLGAEENNTEYYVTIKEVIEVSEEPGMLVSDWRE